MKWEVGSAKWEANTNEIEFRRWKKGNSSLTCGSLLCNSNEIYALGLPALKGRDIPAMGNAHRKSVKYEVRNEKWECKVILEQGY